jgi:hypothetical protein
MLRLDYDVVFCSSDRLYSHSHPCQFRRSLPMRSQRGGALLDDFAEIDLNVSNKLVDVGAPVHVPQPFMYFPFVNE